MTGPGRSVCHRHRDELLAFADHRDVTAVDVASLDHLDRCVECRHEVEELALTVIALRRLGAEARRVEAPAEGWPKLRERVARPTAPWRWRVPLGGLVVSAALVAVVLAPAAFLRPPTPYIQEVGLETSIFDAQRAAEDRTEAQILQQQVTMRTQPVPREDPPAAPLVDAVWYGPDGLGLIRDLAVPAATQVRHE